MSSLGIKPFEVGVDRSIRPSDHHPTRFFSPCRRGDDRLEIHSRVEYLRVGHKVGLLYRQIGCKEELKLRGIKVGEPICGRLFRVGFAEITWEELSVFR